MLKIKSYILSVKFSNIVLALILIISLACVKHFRWDGDNGKNKETIISSDGLGYYDYLPSIFIKKNFDNQTFESSFTNNYKGKVVNKYFVGTALLNTPLFLIAHIAAKTLGYETNGYSEPYQLMIAVSALIYLFIGLISLLKLLRLYGVSNINRSISVFLILFGTNLFYYTVIAGSMSHVYSFSMISIFALMIKKLLITNKLRYFYLSSAIFALIILVRPTNGIVLLMPFLMANNFLEIKRLFFFIVKKWQNLFISLLIFLSIISIQSFLWYIQTGSFIVWSYSGEGFNFLKPQIINVLFSFRKGLFIYTPLIFISLLGLRIVYKNNKYQFVTTLLFLSIVTYIISSWWNWYYGDSYGLRAYIDYYFIFCILLGLILQSCQTRFEKSVFLYCNNIYFIFKHNTILSVL